MKLSINSQHLINISIQSSKSNITAQSHSVQVKQYKTHWNQKPRTWTYFDLGVQKLKNQKSNVGHSNWIKIQSESSKFNWKFKIKTIKMEHNFNTIMAKHWQSKIEDLKSTFKFQNLKSTSLTLRIKVYKTKKQKAKIEMRCQRQTRCKLKIQMKN